MKCIVHVCGPQASGKTTLTGILANILRSRGIRVLSLTMYPFGSLNYVLCSLLLSCILADMNRDLRRRLTRFLRTYCIHPLEVLLSERFINITRKILPLIVTFEYTNIVLKVLIIRIALAAKVCHVIIIDEGVFNVLAIYYHLSYKMYRLGLHISGCNLPLSRIISLYLRALKSGFKGFKSLVLLLTPSLSIVVKQRAKRGDVLPLRVIIRDYYIFRTITDKITKVIIPYLNPVIYNLTSVSKEEILKIVLKILNFQVDHERAT